MCVKEFPKFCPLEFPSENSKKVAISKEDRKIVDFLTVFGEMSDEDFLQFDSSSDMIPSDMISDEDVFENEEWYRYTPVESFNLLGDTRHGLDIWDEGIQSADSPISIDLVELYLRLESGSDKYRSKVLESLDHDDCNVTGHTIQTESRKELMQEIANDDVSSDCESYYDCESDLESNCDMDLSDSDYISADESLEDHLGYPSNSSESPVDGLEGSQERELLSCFVGQGETVQYHTKSHDNFDKEEVLHVLLNPLEEVTRRDVEFLKHSSDVWDFRNSGNLTDRGTEDYEEPERRVYFQTGLDNENRASYGDKIDETYQSCREHKVVVPTVFGDNAEINTTEVTDENHSHISKTPIDSEKIYDVKNVYSEMLFSQNDAEEGESSLWSILTDTIQYVIPETENSQRKFTAKLSKNPIYQNPKDLYFNADHTNEPMRFQTEKATSKYQSRNDYKLNLFKADNRNDPNQICELDERYGDLKVGTMTSYHPDKCVSTTYLWKDTEKGKPLIVKTYDSWFSEGRFPINLNSETTGYLMDGTPMRVKTLIDSGASKPIFSMDFYKKHKFLHTYPKYKIKAREILLGDGHNNIVVDKCITVLLNFAGHVFEVTCYLAPIMDDYDFIIGQKSMYELEGGPNFGNLTFHFLMRSVDIIARDDVYIRRGDRKKVYFKMKEAPPGFKSGRGILKLKSDRNDKLPQTILVDIKNKKIELDLQNQKETDLFIRKGELVGSLDMRSLGYFHISRDTLQEVLGERCDLLTEPETEEYFNLWKEDHKEILCYAKTLTNTKLVDTTTNLEKEDDYIREQLKIDKDDPYPWLDKEDPRRDMTDREIVEKFINLSESDLSNKEKKRVIDTILKYKKAFSLRDEIGLCPNMEIELELNDTSPFFIRPFPIKESEKDIVDKEMRKGCLLGILKKGMSSYSSPIMLIPRKLTGIPRIVTDFRHLNSRLVTLQPSIPLVRDAIQILGSSGCEILSVIDLRDAYHTLRLSERSKKFCGITPYYGSDTYLYQRLGMGLSVSPAIWQNFIQKVLSEIPNHRKNHLAIMDDCLVHSKKKDHLEHLINLFKALIRNGLKISPKKCQLFRTKLVYMGHIMMIEEGLPKITPIKSRTDAIVKQNPPTTAKQCKQFCGLVNYLSIFLKDLQQKLIPIYHLTRKGVPFHWGEEQQRAFDEIKQALVEPPVLVMPRNKGHLILVSDTSITACGSALYQLIEGRYRLIAYYSKKLPEAVRRYSISELELTGILANVSAFKHILRNTNFTVYCDHSALIHILQAKREPPTLRLMKLIENLSQYKFNIKFLNGKEMHISDFLSRNPYDDEESPNEIIPIAFVLRDMVESFMQLKEKETLSDNLREQKVLTDHLCYKCDRVLTLEEKEEIEDEKLCIITRSMAKAAKAEVPKMYPLIGEHRKPEKAQTGVIDMTQPEPEVQVETGPGHEENSQLEEVPNLDHGDVTPIRNGPDVQSTEIQIGHNLKERAKQRGEYIPNYSSLDPVRVQKAPIEPVYQRKGQIQQIPQVKYEGLLNPIPINVELTGQLPAYDVDRIFDYPSVMPSEEDLKRQSSRLFKFIPNKSIFRRHVPKQVELNRFLEELKRKVIHDYNIPVTVKELRAEYPRSPYFGDIYKYITKENCRFVGKARKLFRMQCEDYIVMDGVLFKIRYDKGDRGNPSLVLCIPEKYIPTILHQYHDTVLAGHPGSTKLFETIKQKYYFHGMFPIIRQYVQGCLECQSMKDKTDRMAIHYPRIPLDYTPMSRISMDVKHMPKSKLGYKYILVCTCESTNWIVGIPIANEEAATIAEALYFKVICTYGTPKAVICDEGPALTSELMKMYFHALNIKPYYISPMNHGSNRTERYIRTLTDIICKNLKDTGDEWPLYVYPACYAMNTQVSLVTGFSPYEMIFNKTPPDLFKFDFDPEKSRIKVTTSKYMEFMRKRYARMRKIVLERKAIEAQTQYIRSLRRNPDYEGYAVGDLIYFDHGPGSDLHMPSRKLNRNWLGPLRVQTILDDTHYLISDWKGELMPIRVHVNRIKPFTLNIGTMTVEGLLEIARNTEEVFTRWRAMLKTQCDNMSNKIS